MPQYEELDSRDIVSEFFQEFEATRDSGWAPRVAMSIDSSRETEEMEWIGHAPEMRQWLNGRQVDSPDKRAFTLTNVPYEGTMGLRLADLRRDKTQFLRARVAEMGAKANQHWEVLLSAEMEANGNSYDGAAMFSATHAESGSNQINEATSTHIGTADVADATSPTADEAAAVITELTGYMYTYTDDKGTPANGDARNFLIMVGGTYQAAFYGACKRAVEADRLASGASNVIPSLDWNIDVVMNPRLTSTSNAFIYCFATDTRLKPYLMVDEQPLTTELLGSGSDWEFHHQEHLFGVKATRTVGPGNWMKAIRVTLS